ncbi:acyltransferase [Patescibacteria group bacterium]
MNKKHIEIIKNKGILESLVYAFYLIRIFVFSRIKIIFLNLRGYKIDSSVTLRGSCFFFQSIKNSIVVSEYSKIGKNTRISCGEQGKIFIGENVLIDDYSYIMSHEKISIGDNTTIAGFCFIVDFNHEFSKKNLINKQKYIKTPIVIEEDVWIGTHTTVLSGVTIGKGAVIGAGSVVTKSIKPYSIAVGNPAKVIKSRL